MCEESKALRSLKAKVLRLLTNREYTRYELEQKILNQLKRGEEIKSQYGDQVALLEKVLDECEYCGLLSDTRFVESFINQKSYKLGQRRLEQELQAKGVSSDLLKNALEKTQENEYDRAYDVWSKKFKSMPIDQKSLQKQIRFLLYRGFNMDAIKKIFAEFKRENIYNKCIDTKN